MAQPAADQSASPEQLHEAIAAIRDAIGQVIVGQHPLVDRLLVALLTNNHVLIEGVPGLAKTLTVQTFSQVLHASFSRVQFTPDLLPADITGTLIFNPRDGDFAVRRGPIFVNIVLADEINRAPAKVQSALLEAMQERQVSIGGETFALPDPFMVLATQNPIEQEGTYPLPEAQLDRFMLKILVDYPGREDERTILARALDEPTPSIQPVVGPQEIAALRSAVRAVEINDSLREYILRLVESTRDPARYRLEELAPLIEFGASPRAATFLARGAQAYAFVHGRDYATPDDVKELAPDVLRHRLVLSYEAEAQSVSAEDLVSRLLGGVGIP
ncbi:MAG: MoxR family ATPase [Dehalococcoidia bacterium]|jgi:MoxR-like ATPase|nr:MoxR family ATPase [Dehalococcoidia bacterium]